jgi:hypothetical protein
MDVVQILSLIGIIVAIVGVPWYLRGHFARLEAQANRTESKLNELIRVSNTLSSLNGTLINLLHAKKILDDDNFRTVLGTFTKALNVQEISPNPLSPEELQRLNGYVRKAQRGDFFNSAEVEDYNTLVRTVEHEKPNDPNIWPLVALGAFLLGLFLASKE